MATTDQRAGFRLPWSSDQRPTADEPGTGANDMDAPGDAPVGTAGEAARHEGDVTRDDVTAMRGATDTAGPGSADHYSTETQHMSADAPMDTAAYAPKRPTKFLADLTKAMQVAAEAARAQTLTQLQADAKAYVEEIHGRSSGDATELRKQADDDIAGIRDWSKAEIARIREETEAKITGRKAELEGQLERHAGVIEREIERIQGQVAAFEGEMAYFFERLLVEEDPTKFAVMAENLPEPPPFEMRGEGQAAVASSGIAVMEPKVEDETVAEAVAEAVAVEDEPAEGMVEVEDTGEAVADGATDTLIGDGMAEAATDELVSAEEREAAFAAIQAAFEAAATAEAGAPAEEAVAEAVVAEDEPIETPETVEVSQAEALAEPAEDVADDADEVETNANLRLTALGLNNFDAAEAEAAASVDSAEDEIPTISDDALAARLAGLVPGRSNEEHRPVKQAAAMTTQVVVVGLVSVASIASFKRHLGRIPGVQSVGVSSGPDGEFVFSVNHNEDVSLRDVVPTLPGFQARISNAGDGVVNVAAHDPESEG